MDTTTKKYLWLHWTFRVVDPSWEVLHRGFVQRDRQGGSRKDHSKAASEGSTLVSPKMGKGTDPTWCQGL